VHNRQVDSSESSIIAPPPLLTALVAIVAHLREGSDNLCVVSSLFEKLIYKSVVNFVERIHTV